MSINNNNMIIGPETSFVLSCYPFVVSWEVAVVLIISLIAITKIEVYLILCVVINSILTRDLMTG